MSRSALLILSFASIMLGSGVIGWIMSDSMTTPRQSWQSSAAVSPRGTPSATAKTLRLPAKTTASEASLPWDQQLATRLMKIAESQPDSAEALLPGLERLLQSLSPANIAVVVDAYEAAGLFDTQHYHAMALLMKAWSRFDRTGPLDFMLQQVGTETTDALTTTLMLELPATEVLGYLSRQPESVQDAAVQNYLAYAREHTRAAEDFEERADPVRLTSLGSILRRWVEADPEQARSWLAQFSQSSEAFPQQP